MKLFLSTSAIAVLICVLAPVSVHAVLPPGAGDLIVNIDNSTITKLNAADGSIQWSVPITNDGSVKVDPADLSIYTSLRGPNSETTVYKLGPEGTVSSTSNLFDLNNGSTAAGASPNYLTVCGSYTDVNPADNMVYRGGGDTAAGGCGPMVYQTNKFNSGAIDWSME